jgi:GH15 family glucan-1,4-alpha-glucosidase
MIKRSAITLKLLQHYSTGALVAAPTASLPEAIGKERNWDYRYSWMRDATFTLYALAKVGLKEETERFLSYVDDVLTKHEQEDTIGNLKHLYTIHGNEVKKETTLEHLNGYQNSSPVRIGNDACEQFQLDSYGVMIDAFYLAYQNGVRPTIKHRSIIIDLINKIDEKWRQKGRGIWEIRGPKKHYTYSKVMCWVGINRAIRLQSTLSFGDAYTEKLKKLEERIHDWIWEHCYNEDKQIITQHPKTNAQDATTFLFPLVQFLDKNKDRTAQIIQNARDELCFNDTFVYRYRNDDGLDGQEGAFFLCTFWMISALAKIGASKEAVRIFRSFETEFADSGLMSEEIDDHNKDYLGNFPQAFSHMGYIMSAYYLQKYASDSEWFESS